MCLPLSKLIEYRIGISCLPVRGVNSMSNEERSRALSNFRQGTVKCLVATCSLEEGLDVPDCKVVIRFDYFASVRSHIQGSGRARHPDAMIYYFEQDPELEQSKVRLLALAATNPCEIIPDVTDQARPGGDCEPNDFDANHVHEYESLQDAGVG